MNIPHKILPALALLVCSTGAMAQDSYGQNAYSALSPFEGVYAGAYTGGRFNPGTSVTLGVVAGANFSVTDTISVGLEGQGGAAFASPTQYDALMVGHLGYELNDQAMVYGAAGAGFVNGTGSYVAGVGAEVMALQDVGIRGEILGTGAWGGGLNGAKASAGVLWHLR